MRIRRLLVSVLILAPLSFGTWEAHRAIMGLLIWRGEIALVERLGGEPYFLAAARRATCRAANPNRNWELSA
jgi:hypothetical protein